MGWHRALQELSSSACGVAAIHSECVTDHEACARTAKPKHGAESVNSMANNLTGQVRNIAEVTIAVANGDLSKKITVDVRGEILLLKEAINTMVDQLRSFASEVTRVAREVGTEGKLGGQALVAALSHCRIERVAILLARLAHAAATTSRHACMAEARKARCVLAEMR